MSFMKKFFTLFALAFVALVVNAQKITFVVGGSTTEWSNGDFKITATDTGNKLKIDANSAYFGTPSDYIEYETRLKSGGKSDSKLFLTAAIPADGTLKISARTGSNSATDRNVIVTQDGKELLNKILLESEAAKVMIEEVEKSVYPVISVPVKAGEATITFPVGSINFYAFEFVAGGADPEPTPTPGGDAEKYVAISNVDGTWVLADVFANATVADGQSIVTFGTASMDVAAVGGTTAKDVYQDPGTEFAGWTEWNDVKWDAKNQGDINFGYVLGTGNPAVSFTAEEVLAEDQRTGHYRPAYAYYEADGSKGMPVMGLYYKFSPKADGQLKVAVWSNKGNRNTFVVDEATKQPVAYTVEGYINAQDEVVGYNEDGSEIKKKKWLTNEEIQALHDAAKVKDGVDTAPYVIGAGNQPFWGNINLDVVAGKTYWVFQHSSQIGFQGFEFTPTATGIEEIVAAPAALNNAAFNLAGQRVAKSAKGLVIINGKKYMNK